MSVYDDVIAKTENLAKVKKVVVSLSGGLDSTTLLYLMVKKFGKENVYAVSFQYQQRHDIELIQAQKTTKKLGVVHKILAHSTCPVLTVSNLVTELAGEHKKQHAHADEAYMAGVF